MGTYDLTKEIEQKHISQAIIQKINLTRILWAGRCMMMHVMTDKIVI